MVITLQKRKCVDILFKKNNLLRPIFDTLDDPIFVLSTEKIILDCNRSFTNCFSGDYVEIVGKNIRQLNIFSENTISMIINAAIEQDKYTFEHHFTCVDGGHIPAIVSSQKFDYNNHKAILCTIKSTGEIKKIKKSLKLSETKCLDIIENINDGIAIIQNGHVQFANCKCAEMIGYTKEEVIGENYLSFISPAYCERVVLHYNSAIDNQNYTGKQFEIDLIAKDGQLVNIEVSDSTIDFENKRSYLVIFREITKRKQSEKIVQTEKKRLENYLDVAGSIIGIVDKDQQIVLVNKKGCEILGYSRNEIIGKNWFDAFLPEMVREQSREGFVKMMHGEIEPPEYMENWIVTKNGEERLVYWHDVVLKDEDGNITGTISSGEDITDQKIMQKQIRDSESKLNTIFNSVGDQIYICDQDRNIIDINDSVVKHLGYERDELLDMKYDQLIVPELRNTTEECAKELIEKKHLVFETSLLGKNGSISPVEINARFIDYDGQKAIICVDRDISERKNAEDKLKKYAEYLRESNELKELFTDIIRHDLLTPASIVKGYSEELLTKEWNANTLSMLKKIYDNNERLITLLESATKLSKLQKIDEIEFEDLNIVTIFQMVIECLKPNIKEKHQTVSINTDRKCNAMVNYVIEEVFSNLLSNAIKYSPNDSNICVDFIDLNDEWKITVSDEGTGIRNEDKKYIFDRFGRADKTGVKGTGLGLAIVKRVIELHGGKLGVTDNPNGQGSIFWVTVKKSSPA